MQLRKEAFPPLRDIEDPAPAERLTGLLAGVPGLWLVGATQAADAAVVTSTAVSQSPDAPRTGGSARGGVKQGDCPAFPSTPSSSTSPG